MEKQLFDDPLFQPVPVWFDLLSGICEEFKDWLKTLGVDRPISSRQFETAKSSIDALSRVTEKMEEQKLLFLFSGHEMPRCFDPVKLEEERINAISRLFFREYGTFYYYVGKILPGIKIYAETHPAFRKKYEEAKKHLVKHSSVVQRMKTYLYSNRPYPLELIGELERIDVPELVPDLLFSLYWGREIYLTMCRVMKGDTDEKVYRAIPKWNQGNHSYIPFIAYAVMKQDMKILDAVFEGTDGIEIIRHLAYLFHGDFCDDEYRCFPGWSDKAMVRDFYPGNCGEHREYRGFNPVPDEEDKAELFLKYIAELAGRDGTGTVLRIMRLFLFDAASKENALAAQYLDFIERTGKAENTCWKTIKAIAEKAAAYPVAVLLRPETFKNCRWGVMGRTVFYILEMYFNKITPDRNDIILLIRCLRVVIENQFIDTPHALPWLFKYARITAFCIQHIDEPDFLKELVNAAGESGEISWSRCILINYIVIIWLLHVCQDKKIHPVWPVCIDDETQRQFDGTDGENPVYTAAALLLSEGKIKPEPVLLDCIWTLFEEGNLRGPADQSSILYRYFIRANEDEDRVDAMLGEIRSGVTDKLLVMRYLRTHKQFDFDDFILHLDAAAIGRLSPEAFSRYHTTPDEAVLYYLERRGNTCDKIKHITSRYRRF
jgi:hypothetical protein